METIKIGDKVMKKTLCALWVALFVIFVMVVLAICQEELISTYEENFECHKLELDKLYHKCDSLLDANYELAKENYNLKDTIIILKYKED